MKCHYSEGLNIVIVILSMVIMSAVILSVFKLNALMMSVVMLSSVVLLLSMSRLIFVNKTGPPSQIVPF
jgi:hypothetical protein